MSDAVQNIKELLESKGINQLFAYSRKSRDIDNEGLKKHHDVIMELAEQLGFPKVDFYEEVESSETLNREQLNKLREDIKKKRVRALVVYRLDRLSRKVTDTERLLKEFQFQEVILIEANRNKVIDYNEIMGLKLESIMNDLYQEQAKMVLQAGKEKSIALYGNHLGESPMGYDYDPQSKKLVPNQDAPLIKKIFQLASEGYSTHSIALKLNNEGFRTKRGSIFKGRTVWKMLQNEKYIGWQVYGKQEWFKDQDGKYHVKNKPREEWLVYEQAHEPIVSEEMFNKVKEVLESKRTVPTGKRTNTHILTGLVKCGGCGWNMTLVKRNESRVSIRGCARRDYITGERCGNKGNNQDAVVEILREHLWKTVRPAVMKTKRELAKNRKTFQRNGSNGDKKDLEKQIAELTKQMDNLIDMQIDMGKSERLIVRMKQIEAQLKLNKERLQELEDIDPDDSLAWVDSFLEDAKDLIDYTFNWQGMTDEDKNLFLKKYFDHATVLDGEVTEVVYSDEVQRMINTLQEVE